MRFGNRFVISRGNLHRERWDRYWRHLDELGFSKNDPLYRLFGGEVFHDGEISIDQIRLIDGVVILQLRNVHAVDEVDRLLHARKGKKTPKLKLADFRTKVTFRGVKHLELRLKRAAKEFYYYCAELDRRGDDIQVTIYFIAADEDPGWIKILFESADFEDISGRLKRYLPPDVSPNDAISYVETEQEAREQARW